jgi:hypothetical protein
VGEASAAADQVAAADFVAAEPKLRGCAVGRPAPRVGTHGWNFVRHNE